MSSPPATGPARVPGPHRRAVLVGGPVALAAVLTGCTSGAAPDRDPAPPAPPDPDDALRSAAAERERGLLGEYDAVLRGLPALAGRLAPLRAHHEQHLSALLGPPGPASPTPAASDGPAPTAAASSPASPAAPAPTDPAAALARLAGVERAAGAAHAQDCLAASRALAPLLASLSASELSHPVALA